MFAKLLLALPLLGSLSVTLAATCKNPSVRREWRSFTTQQKADWIAAVKCLSHLPHTDALTPSVDPSISQIVPMNSSGSYYDDFVYMHMDLNTRIHFTGLFLPWHRWYVYVYETALKTKCGYKGVSPYWNWTKDAHDVHGSAFFQDSDPVSGLGGWGDPAHDIEVQDGGFSHGFDLSYPSYHHLRRNFTLRPWLGLNLPFVTDTTIEVNTSFTESEVSKMVNGFVGDYRGFQAYFEGFLGAHGSVHLIMGGDLAGQCPENAPAGCTPAPTYSANEPLFWMHHAMVDKVWYDWQHANKENLKAYVGGSVQALDSLADYEQYPTGAPPNLTTASVMPADGLFPTAEIGDVLSTTGGILCYVYDS